MQFFRLLKIFDPRNKLWIFRFYINSNNYIYGEYSSLDYLCVNTQQEAVFKASNFFVGLYDF